MACLDFIALFIVENSTRRRMSAPTAPELKAALGTAEVAQINACRGSNALQPYAANTGSTLRLTRIDPHSTENFAF
jgi:hypothetical protein